MLTILDRHNGFLSLDNKLPHSLELDLLTNTHYKCENTTNDRNCDDFWARKRRYEGGHI